MGRHRPGNRDSIYNDLPVLGDLRQLKTEKKITSNTRTFQVSTIE
nr:MAG TPA: hypothetical protein [Caudoviricetes sp.]